MKTNPNRGIIHNLRISSLVLIYCPNFSRSSYNAPLSERLIKNNTMDPTVSCPNRSYLPFTLNTNGRAPDTEQVNTIRGIVTTGLTTEFAIAQEIGLTRTKMIQFMRQNHRVTGWADTEYKLNKWLKQFVTRMTPSEEKTEQDPPSKSSTERS